MKKNTSTSQKKTAKIFTIIALIALVFSIASCSTPRCGYMKCYNRDVRMGIAH